MEVVAAEDLQQYQRKITALEAELAARTRESVINDQQMARIYSFIMGLLNVIPGALFVVSDDGRIRRSNPAAVELLGFSEAELNGSPLTTVYPDAEAVLKRYASTAQRTTAPIRLEANFLSKAGEPVPVFLSVDAQRSEEDAGISIVLVAMDLRERRKLEVELRHAQKLESIGQLSAGVAHEINTPMQFIGDNIGFISDAVPGLLTLIESGRKLLACTPEERGDVEATLIAAAEAADLDFLEQRLPRAVKRSLEGVDRVKRIVEAMKVFSHPSSEPEPLDLNKLIENTLVLTANEYKYLATIKTEFGALPLIPCGRTDLSQVFINLITNSAHAIAEAYPGASQLGTITIRTQLDPQQNHVEVQIEDDGPGIPDKIKGRVFDPFFTTKPVGKGTGQGLAISRSIIVDGHHGQLWFEAVHPHGTRFHLVLPLSQPSATEAF
jgi:two-component system, NtrC family, sensor kinase